MAKKKKCNCKQPETYQPIYIQSSNPSPEILAWAAEMSETRIVYFQSGKPAQPCGLPGFPPCK